MPGLQRSEALTYDDAGNLQRRYPWCPPSLIACSRVSRFRPRFRDAPRQRRRGPTATKKLVVVAPGMNPFSDFHMFAKTPVAATSSA